MSDRLINNVLTNRRMTDKETGILLKYRNSSMFMLQVMLLCSATFIYSTIRGLMHMEPGVWGISMMALLCVAAADFYFYFYFSRYDEAIKESAVSSLHGIVTDIYSTRGICYCVLEGIRFKLPGNRNWRISRGEEIIIEYCSKSFFVFNLIYPEK